MLEEYIKTFSFILCSVIQAYLKCRYCVLNLTMAISQSETVLPFSTMYKINVHIWRLSTPPHTHTQMFGRALKFKLSIYHHIFMLYFNLAIYYVGWIFSHGLHNDYHKSATLVCLSTWISSFFVVVRSYWCNNSTNFCSWQR